MDDYYNDLKNKTFAPNEILKIITEYAKDIFFADLKYMIRACCETHRDCECKEKEKYIFLDTGGKPAKFAIYKLGYHVANIPRAELSILIRSYGQSLIKSITINENIKKCFASIEAHQLILDLDKKYTDDAIKKGLGVGGFLSFNFEGIRTKIRYYTMMILLEKINEGLGFNVPHLDAFGMTIKT